MIFAEINQISNTNQQLLRSKKRFNSNDIITSFSKSKVGFDVTYLTVQISEKEHISLQPEFLQYINHSCDPNVFFDVDSMNLIALKDIEENEELTFFYPSTEWKMVQPFDCFCESENCLKTIKGASYIELEVLKKYKLSSFISRKSGFCHCGSLSLFSTCCEPIIKGEVKVDSAEKLMRSRYSAYAISDAEYLMETSHSALRKQQNIKDIKKWADENKWQKLEVFNVTETTVEFKAYFLDSSKQQQVHYEKSTFILEDGKWLYLSGVFG
jgi:uncharacterized protein YchJ